MEKVFARDIMIPLDQYPHIPFWFTLRQAMIEMEAAELNVGGRKSLPRVVLIMDEKYRLLGMIRRRDILRGLEPEFLRELPIQERKELFSVHRDPDLSDLSFDKIAEEVKRRGSLEVRDFMIPIEATVDYDDHIVRIIYEMNSHNLSDLPVTKHGSVVGVVRSVDVFHRVAEGLL